MKMRRTLIPLLLTSTASMGAMAAEPARNAAQLRALAPIKSDKSGPGEIRVVGYSALKRTEVTGIVGEPTTIVFPTSESVYRIVQSKTPNGKGELTETGWVPPKSEEGKPPIELGNQLPMWPISEGTTSLTVTTCIPEEQGHCKYGSQKPYYFRLTAISKDAAVTDPNVTTALIFKGGVSPSGGGIVPAPATHLAAMTGDDPPPKRAPSKRKRQAEAELAEAQERLRTDSFNATGGCHYNAQGPKDSPITPLCPMDNGIWTLFRFSGLSPKPAVYVSDPTKLCGVDKGIHERLVRQGAADDLVVVQEIAQRFCLRLGDNVLQVDNLAYSPSGKPTGTGTIAPTVNRVILKAAK